MVFPGQKGKLGEREFAGILENHLGVRVVVAPHDNSADIQSIEGLAIEVKRVEKLTVDIWWRQTQRQADDLGAIPVLAYRQNRKSWTVCLPAYLLTLGDKKNYISMPLDTFLSWLSDYRE